MFKFSLAEALVNPAALDAKVSQVRQLARKKLLDLQNQRSSPDGLTFGDPDDWLGFLRLLDAVQSKKTLAEIGSAIFFRLDSVTDKPTMSNKELIKLVRQRKVQAETLAGTGYLWIAASPQRRAVT